MGVKKMKHSRRRHGLYGHELEAVHEAVRHKLQHLAEERSNLHDAEILFKVLFRMDHHHGKVNMGRVRYPPDITMRLIQEYLNNGPFNENPSTHTEEPKPSVQDAGKIGVCNYG